MLTGLEARTLLKPFCGSDNDNGRFMLSEPWCDGERIVATDTKILAWTAAVDEPATSFENGRKPPPVDSIISQFPKYWAGKPLPLVQSRVDRCSDRIRVIDGMRFWEVNDYDGDLVGLQAVRDGEVFTDNYDLMLDGVRFGLELLGKIVTLAAGDHKPHYVVGHVSTPDNEKGKGGTYDALWFECGDIRGVLMSMREAN